MKRNPILTVFWIIVMSLPASATIINIPDDYPTIQEGIDASTDGDTVLVQPGAYWEYVSFGGHNVVLGSLFLTTGDTSYISNTIIDGDTMSFGGVGFSDHEDTTTVIAGFTISNSLGIYCWQSDPVIRNNNIINNTYVMWPPMGEGGGISCDDCNVQIINNNIIGNFSFKGGGIYCNNSNVLISGNNIIGNSASFYGGGGIYIDGYRSNARINNNIIIGNSVSLEGRGGGVYIACSNQRIMNNVIKDNYAEGYGGGMYVPSYLNVAAINNIFWDNLAGIGDEIYAHDSLNQITYNDIQGGWEGEGNIDVDPLFRDPENGDYHLMSTACGDPYDSPCIDVGHPDIIDSLLDCSWGLGTILSDMGAYDDGDTATVGINDQQPRVPDRFALMQNYPNPFNAMTVIRYSLPAESDVTIEIYDILGRRIQTLFSGNRPAGSHSVIWDARDLPSGIYLYRIDAGEYSQTRRCLLLK